MKTKQAIQLALIGSTFGILTSSTLAESVAETLEQGVQLQQTDGDYDAAIERYESVLKHQGKWKKLAAEARFRLAECFLAKDDIKSATKQVNNLRKDYPADNRWVLKAGGLLPVETAFSGAPWKNGHIYAYTVQMKNGQEIGQFALAERMLVGGDDPEWESYLVRTAGTESMSRTHFKQSGYQVLDSRWYMRGMGDAQVSFDEGTMVRIVNPETGEETDSYDHSKGNYAKMPIYENEQMVQLIRTLDQKVGTKQNTVLIASLNGAVPIEFNMEVTAHEEIQVPAGKFDCAKVETNLKQTFHISRGEDRQIVQIDMGPAKVKLAAEQAWNPDANRPISAKKLGVSFEIPGKMIGLKPVDNDEVYRLQMWSTDFAGWDTLLEVNWTKNLIEKVKNADAFESSRAFADAANEAAGEKHDEWSLSEKSWEEIDIDGVKGVAVSANGRDGEIALHTYQIFAVDEEKALVIRTNHTGPELDKARARAMELAKSFKW